MAIGSNLPFYPRGLDKSMRMETDFCNTVAGDINDLYESLLAIETELGVDPSGEFGSLHSRLFANGMLAKKGKGWRRLEQVHKLIQGKSLDLTATNDARGFSVNFQAARFEGYEGNTLETGRPLIFADVNLPYSVLNTMVGTRISAFILSLTVTQWRIDENKVYLVGFVKQATSPDNITDIGIMVLFWGLS